MMFQQVLLGPKRALAMEQAIQKTISVGVVTHDLARRLPDIREVKCSEFAEGVVGRLR